MTKKKKTKKKISKPRVKKKQQAKKHSPKVAVVEHKGTKKENFEVKMEILLTKGKQRGFVTYDEILKEFPTIEDSVSSLDELYERITTMGVDVLEGGNLLDAPTDDEAALKKLLEKLKDKEKPHDDPQEDRPQDL